MARSRGRFRVTATVRVEISRDAQVIWDQSDSERAARDVERDMVARFGAGKDANGKPWRPYSADYAKDHPGQPDNIETGQWRAAIAAEASDEEAVVGVKETDPRALGWAYADAMRPVSGLSAATVEELVSDWEDALEKRGNVRPEVLTPARARAKAAANRRKADRPKRKTRKKV